MTQKTYMYYPVKWRHRQPILGIRRFLHKWQSTFANICLGLLVTTALSWFGFVGYVFYEGNYDRVMAVGGATIPITILLEIVLAFIYLIATIEFCHD